MISEFEVLISGQQFKKLYEKKCEVIMEEYNLRKVEIDILYFLSNCGSSDTAKDIMKLKFLSKAHISKAIENLSHRNYVFCCPDAEDKRWIHLRLTENANPIIEKIKIIREILFAAIFVGITEEEKNVMIRIASKIAANINKELGEEI